MYRSKNTIKYKMILLELPNNTGHKPNNGGSIHLFPKHLLYLLNVTNAVKLRIYNISDELISNHSAIINSTQLRIISNITASSLNTEEILRNRKHHKTMLLILMLIFMVITLSITVAIVVFCRKKNSVFILQKSEQVSDVEMDDMNTEIEISDEDSDNDKKCKVRRKSTNKFSMTSAKSDECLIRAQEISSGGYIPIETSSLSSTPLLSNTHKDFQIKTSVTEGEKSFKLIVARGSLLPKSKSFSSIHESQKFLLNVPKSGQYNETAFGSQQRTDLKVETMKKKEKEYIQQIPSHAITDFKFRCQQNHGQSKIPVREYRSLPHRETGFHTVADKGLSQDDDDDVYHFDGRLQIM